MFTGIIESMAEVVRLENEGTNLHLYLNSMLSNELKVDQSVSHNGVCLTVVGIDNEVYKVTAVEETLLRTNLAELKVGTKVNIERCMPAGGRFDGHIVQGHVDQLAKVLAIEDRNGSWLFTFEFLESEHLVVEKGSVTVNGTSLTCFNCTDNQFAVAIIPYTYEHTNFHQLAVGDRVNIEFDIIGKYVQRILMKN